MTREELLEKEAAAREEVATARAECLAALKKLRVAHDKLVEIIHMLEES